MRFVSTHATDGSIAQMIDAPVIKTSSVKKPIADRPHGLRLVAPARIASAPSTPASAIKRTSMWVSVASCSPPLAWKLTAQKRIAKASASSALASGPLRRVAPPPSSGASGLAAAVVIADPGD